MLLTGNCVEDHQQDDAHVAEHKCSELPAMIFGALPKGGLGPPTKRTLPFHSGGSGEQTRKDSSGNRLLAASGRGIASRCTMGWVDCGETMQMALKLMQLPVDIGGE